MICSWPHHCFQLALISDLAQDQCQLFLIRRNGPQKLFNNGMQQLKLRSCKMNSPSARRPKRVPPSPSLMHRGKEKLLNPLLELLASCLHLEVFIFVHHSPFHQCTFYIRPQFVLYCCCCCFSAQGNSSHQQKPSASSGKPICVCACDFVLKLTDSFFDLLGGEINPIYSEISFALHENLSQDDYAVSTHGMCYGLRFNFIWFEISFNIFWVNFGVGSRQHRRSSKCHI